MEDRKVGRVEPEYTMQIVVSRTGVPADTIRSWERRHGFPRPARDETNMRVYSDSDIRAIVRLNELRALGWPISKALVQMQSSITPAPTEILSVPASRSSQLQAPPSRRSPEKLARLLDAFQEDTARRALSDEVALMSVEHVCFSLLLPLVTPSGAEDRIGAFRAGFVRRVLFSLYSASSPGSGRATVLLAGVPGTMDECHLLSHAICISRAGYRTVMLGTDVALNEAESAIVTIRPQAVMMTADTENSAWTLARWSHRLNVERPVEGWNGSLLFAGSIFRKKPELAEDVVGAQVPDDPDGATAVVERAIGNPNPSLHLLREP